MKILPYPSPYKAANSTSIVSGDTSTLGCASAAVSVGAVFLCTASADYLRLGFHQKHVESLVGAPSALKFSCSKRRSPQHKLWGSLAVRATVSLLHRQILSFRTPSAWRVCYYCCYWTRSQQRQRQQRQVSGNQFVHESLAIDELY